MVNEVADGVVSLFKEPIKGFKKGPLEGGKGLLIGTGKFVQHVGTGSVNTVDRILKAIANQTAKLTFD